MSILDNDFSNYPTPAQQAAMALVHISKNAFTNMVDSFNDGAEIFWKNSMGASPAEVSEALGADAKEIFELHSKLGQLIATVKPEAITKGLSFVGEFTMNEDGTVTIIVPPEPDPVPSGEPVVDSGVVPSGDGSIV